MGSRERDTGSTGCRYSRDRPFGWSPRPPPSPGTGPPGRRNPGPDISCGKPAPPPGCGYPVNRGWVSGSERPTARPPRPGLPHRPAPERRNTAFSFSAAFLPRPAPGPSTAPGPALAGAAGLPGAAPPAGHGRGDSSPHAPPPPGGSPGCRSGPRTGAADPGSWDRADSS